MLPFGVTIPATVPQESEISEGLMNNPVYILHTAISRDWNSYTVTMHFVKLKFLHTVDYPYAMS